MRVARARHVLLVVASLLLVGCTSAQAGPSSPTAPGAPGTSPTADVRAELAALVVDDSTPPGGYVRELFPTWKDIDGDGCDARRQALIAASSTPAQTGARCAVIAGTWTSDYDGTVATDPSAVQIDHVVPLADAWRSGADRWDTQQRTRFANDQAELWVVSAASNQSKGDRGPESWRPPNEAIWCRYAQRWVAIKVQWRLTATTPERDALGQLLDRC